MTDGKPNATITEADLIAFADGTIDPARRALVADAIARDSELAATIAAFRQQTIVLRQVFDPVFAEPIPQKILETVQTDHVLRPWRMLAAACAILTIGVCMGWIARDVVFGDPLGTSLGQRGALAYATFGAHDAPDLDVSSAEILEGHWLIKTLLRDTPVPDLEPLGMKLAGGRLMMGETQPAALLIYHGENGRKLTIFMRSDIDPVRTIPIRQHSDAYFRSAYWAQNEVGFAISGNLSPEKLYATAEFVRAQGQI